MRHMQQLPIWRDANRLLLAIEQAVRHLEAGHPWPARFAQPAAAQIRSRRICPRYHKYALGSDMRRQAMGICRLIIRAYNEQHKPLQQVERLVLSIDDLKCQIQLAKELQAFRHFREFQNIAELVVQVGKQSGGWRKHLAERHSQSRNAMRSGRAESLCADGAGPSGSA